MPTLCVLRHAKSDDPPGTSDHERPLNPRGRESAPRVGRWLRQRGHAPALVLCSSARRAVETLKGLGDLDAADVAVTDDLYLASDGELLRRLRAVPGAVSPVLVIGHNPGVWRLAVELSATGEELPRLTRRFPTAALAVLELDGPWGALEVGRGRLAALVEPAELG